MFHIIPVQLYIHTHTRTRTRTHTQLCCLQSKLHQETCLPSMAVRQRIPLLHFILTSQPLSTREGQECQSSTVQPTTVWNILSNLLHSSFVILVFFQFISLSLSRFSVVNRALQQHSCGQKHLWSYYPWITNKNLLTTRVNTAETLIS